MSSRSRTVVAFLLPWVVLGGLAVVAPAGASAAVTIPGGFTSLTPSRLLDTRIGLGAPAVAVAPGGTVALLVLGGSGVPASGVSAVVLNVTATRGTKPGYVTVHGSGTTRPTASNLNFVAGQTVPNLVIAPVGANGKVALYNGSAGTVHLVADVSGYYLAGVPAANGTFGSLAPSRLLDTRVGLGAPRAAVAAGGTVALQVTGRGGVPASEVSAVVLNVTATAPSQSGYVTAYGDGTTRPTASSLNFVAGQTVPNLVIAPVGANGKVALYNGAPGTVQLVADVAGYYLSGTPDLPGAFGSLAPSRVLDTRAGVGAPAATVVAGGTVRLKVAGRGGVPAFGVSAVVLNITATRASAPGYVSAYADGVPRPTASNLNFATNQTVPNLVIAPVGTNGTVDLYNGSTGTVQLVADVAGYYRSEAPVAGYAAWDWGTNDFGQLGDDTTTGRPAPGRMGTEADWAQVAAGKGQHTLAVRADGTLWAWGYNPYGQLGDGTTTTRLAPVQVGTDTRWASVAVGYSHTVAVRTDGTLWAWGHNGYGQLGDGTTTNRPAPVQVGTDTHWAAVAAGAWHTVGVRTDGTLWAWGGNSYGQLGDGTTTNLPAPAQVGTDTHWATVAGGTWHTVAVRTDGTLWAWGGNSYGQLGDGTNTDRSTPGQVGTDTSWATVAGGTWHTVAVRTDGTLWAWGHNQFGQLGDGTITDRSTPGQAGTDTHWGSVAAGSLHTLVIRTDGTLWACGWNLHGQLGDGTNTDRPSPVQVGIETHWTSVAGGAYHTIGLRW